jgi:hypothetical protein
VFVVVLADMGDGCPGDHCPAVIREMPKATALAKKEANQREIEAQKRAKQLLQFSVSKSLNKKLKF